MTSEIVPAIRFKGDKELRDKLFVPGAYAHPAKGNLYLWLEIIERYTKPGDIILDPLAGIGSTLVAALMGRKVICVELESHFARTMSGYECSGQIKGYKEELIEAQEAGWYVRAGFGADTRVFVTEAEATNFYEERMRTDGDVRGLPDYREAIPEHIERRVIPADCGKDKNHPPHHVQGSWEKMRQNPMLGHSLGEVLIIRGDARALPIESADSVITSPPYEGIAVTAGDQARDPGIKFPYGERTDRGNVKRDGLFKRGYTRPVDAVVSSPPYEEGLGHQGSVQREILRTKKIHGGSRAYTEMTRPDAIITSPPFGEALSGGGISIKGHYNDPGLARRVYSPENMTPSTIVTSPPYDNRLADKYDDGDEARMQYFLAGAESPVNIGNLRGPAYWAAMSLTYQECYRVLRPGGLMVLVLKGFTRDGQYVDLPLQTSNLVQTLGFVPFDHWQRELWALSFWRVLQKRRSPETFDDRLNYEEVWAFRKSVG